MTETSAMPVEPTADNNGASGHAKFDFKDVKPIASVVAFENNAPAGAIFSTVHDLAKWMLVQLDGGKLPAGPNGQERRLFTAARQKEMWSLVTPIPIGEPSVAALAAVRPNFLGYGHGWNLADFRGRRIVYHTGGWPGMVSRLTLVPDLKLGVVVLTNQEVGAAFQAVTLHVLDAFLNAPPVDWVAAYAEQVKKGAADADAGWAKHVAARQPNPKPALPLARFAGRFHDAWYGDVLIGEEQGRLVMRFEKTALLVGELEHWQQETFIVRWRDRSLNADAWVTFALTPDAEIDQIKMSPVSPLTDFSFDFQDLLLKPVKK
jgi:CubicO group peptidase (beta-lactamase class C family)